VPAEIGKGIAHKSSGKCLGLQLVLFHVQEITNDVGDARSRRGVCNKDAVMMSGKVYLVGVHALQVTLEFRINEFHAGVDVLGNRFDGHNGHDGSRVHLLGGGRNAAVSQNQDLCRLFDIGSIKNRFIYKVAPDKTDICKFRHRSNILHFAGLDGTHDNDVLSTQSWIDLEDMQ